MLQLARYQGLLVSYVYLPTDYGSTFLWAFQHGVEVVVVADPVADLVCVLGNDLYLDTILQ